jgi:Bacterial Ig domain/Secretion system C-terminal sorting domain
VNAGAAVQLALDLGAHQLGVPVAPVLTSPPDGFVVPDPVVSFVWNSSAEADNYELSLSVNSGPETSHTTADTVQGVTLDWGDAASWKVRGANAVGDGPWSATRNFTVVVMGRPDLSSPEDSSVEPETAVRLIWGATAQATSYHVQVGHSPSFVQLFLDEAGIPDSSLSLANLVRSNTYYWRVRGQNSAASSEWSSTYSFSVADPLPGNVVLAGPADAAVDVPVDVTLAWTAAAGARSYELEVTTSESFSYVDFGGSTDGLSLAPTGLSNLSTYYWRVRAVSTGGAGAWSLSRSFSTTIASPVQPVLLGPTGSTRQPQNPVLVWRPDSLAAVFRVHLSRAATFDTILLDSLVASPSLRLARLVADREHFWRVRGTNRAGSGLWSDAASFITVQNEHPVVVDDSVWVREDQRLEISVLTNDSDPEGHALTVDAIGPAAQGTASLLNSGDISYLPATDYFGDDSLQYSILDELGGWSSGLVHIIVTPLNDPPTPPQLQKPTEGAELFLEGDPTDLFEAEWTQSLDVDGDSLTYRWYLVDRGSTSDTLFVSQGTSFLGTSVNFGTLGELVLRAGSEVGVPKVFFHSVSAADADTTVFGEEKTVIFTRGAITSLTPSSTPQRFEVGRVYPNPAADHVLIEFLVPETGDLSVRVFDIAGRELFQLVRNVGPGRESMELDTSSLPPGVYHFLSTLGALAASGQFVIWR